MKAAKDQWGMSSEDKAGKGYMLLVEANGLARLYEKMGLGAGVGLPTAGIDGIVIAAADGYGQSGDDG